MYWITSATLIIFLYLLARGHYSGSLRARRAPHDVSEPTGADRAVSANRFTQFARELSCRSKATRVGHEAVFDFCGAGAAARRFLAAAGDHLYVRLLDRHQPGGGQKAVRGVRHDASVQLSVRRAAGAYVGRG